MSQQQQYQPPVIQAEETKGTVTQKSNFLAVNQITDILKTSFGSMGMDKMLVDSLGDATITNDGATILKELDINHPAASILIDAAAATDTKVGDGTTSTVLLAGALLAEAEKLINKDIHPNLIIRALKKSSAQLLKDLDTLGIDVDLNDREFIDHIISTTLASKVVSADTDILKNLVVDAVTTIKDKDNKIDLSTLKVEKQLGGSIRDSKLIQGIVLDKEIVHSGMPKKILNAKIALINDVLEIKRSENDSQVNINPNEMFDVSNAETKHLKEMAEKIAKTGANVVICQRGIDNTVQHYLEEAGIIALRRIKEIDIINLHKCTGAKVVNVLDTLCPEDLGHAGVVEEQIADNSQRFIFVEECENANAITILLRGANMQIIDEMERSLHDAIMVLKDILQNPKAVVGGGAAEISLARRIAHWGATELVGRERLVAKAVSNALIELPMTLARNAGMDPIDIELDIESFYNRWCRN